MARTTPWAFTTEVLSGVFLKVTSSEPLGNGLSRNCLGVQRSISLVSLFWSYPVWWEVWQGIREGEQLLTLLVWGNSSVHNLFQGTTSLVAELAAGFQLYSSIAVSALESGTSLSQSRLQSRVLLDRRISCRPRADPVCVVCSVSSKNSLRSNLGKTNL